MIISKLINGEIIKEEVSPEFTLSCDVLCMGAGAAGVYAACSASDFGADVILCEIGANIGGMHVCGNVTGYYHGARGGMHEKEHQKCVSDTVFLSPGNHWEQKQIHITDRIKKSGVRLLCRHSATGVYFNENKAVGLCVFDGEKEINIKAKIIIDATSDGHLIRMCDVEKRMGRGVDSLAVPFTVRTQYVKNNWLNSNNEDSGHIDQYDRSDFSEKTVFAHANASRFLNEGEFINVALHTGIREGLTFKGEDSVLYSDIIRGKTPEKVLFWAYSDLDRHGNDRSVDEELFQNWWVISNLATVTANIPVPMGCIVPKGIKGLVTAGRCLSCDTYSQTAIRMNRDMFRMGECVGIAAALSVQSSTDFLDIDYNNYLNIVTQRNCFTEKDKHRFGYENSYRMYLNKMRSLGRTPDKGYSHLEMEDKIYTPVEFSLEKSFESLKTDAPGIAIGSCFISENKEEIKEKLFTEMQKAHTALYKYNCAIALGLLKDRRSLSVIREIIENRDCFFFTDNRRSNQFRSVVAICLLGRLGTKEDLPLLFSLLKDEEIKRDMYNTLKANYLYHAQNDRNFLYYYVFTHTCTSIVKIYKNNGLNLSELHSFFLELFEGDKIIRRITKTQKGEPAYDETDHFIKHILRITNQG